MAQGTFIGTGITQAPTVDFGKIISQGTKDLIAQQDKKKAEKEREEAKRAELYDKYGFDEELAVLPDSEFRTANDAALEAVSKLRDRYYDVYKQLEGNPNNIELRKRLGNITNNIKRLKATHEKFVQMGKDGLQMIADGTMSGVDEERWREDSEAYDEGRIVVDIDDKDNMSYLFYGKDGKLVNAVRYNEFVKFNPYKKVDIDNIVPTLSKQIGREKYDRVTGGFIKSEDLWGVNQEAQARDLVRSQLESDAVIADILNQATGSTQRDNFTPEQKKAAEEYLVSKIKSSFDQETKLRERAVRSSGGASTKTEPVPTDIINIAVGDDNKALKNTDGNYVYTMSKGIAIDPTKQTRMVNQITYTKDGKIALKGYEQVKDKNEYKERPDVQELARQQDLPIDFFRIEENPTGGFIVYKRQAFDITNKEELNTFANILGVGDIDGLRNALNEKFKARLPEEYQTIWGGGNQQQAAQQPQATQGVKIATDISGLPKKGKQ